MNLAKEYAHLFSPLKGDDSFTDRSPGQISFMNSPVVPLDSKKIKESGARYVFLGAPFDEGNVGRPGSIEGPLEFRVSSQESFPYWFEFNVDLSGSAVDCGDIPMPRVNPAGAREKIYEAVTTVLEAGAIPIICGGDRSVSIPAAHALSDFLGNDKKMGYMHLGAHLDFAESWAGEAHVGACAMARITKLPNLSSKNVAHIGARNAFNPKDHVDNARDRNIRFHPMHEVLERGLSQVLDETITSVWEGTDGQYLSLNLNVADTSCAPGVTTSEPGGFEGRELVQVAERIGAVGGPTIIDITELCPVFDVSAITSRLAACIVLRIMAGVAVSKGETLDDSVRRAGWKLGESRL